MKGVAWPWGVAVRPSYGHCRPPSGADAGPHKLDCLFSSLMPRIIIGIAFAQVPRRIFSSAALRHRSLAACRRPISRTTGTMIRWRTFCANQRVA